MATLVESVREERVIQSWLGELDRISQEMAQGSLEAFYKMGGRLGLLGQDELREAPKLQELVGLVDEKVFASLYVTEKLLSDFWRNFGNGSNFPLSQDCNSFALEITKGLGGFIQGSAFNSGGENVDPMEKLAKAVGAYFSLIKELNSRESL